MLSKYQFQFPFFIVHSPVSLSSRSLLSEFLNSIRNTHATLPEDKLDFILCLLNSPVKLLETEGTELLFI